jgi:peptidoglycan/xylan/chitin deacetylase (PgdA/CDA1 family)
MKKNRVPFITLLMVIFYSCDLGTPPLSQKVTAAITDKASPSVKSSHTFTAKDVLAHKQVPILCFHRIRQWRPTDSKSMKDYIVPVETFREEIKMLADSGYKTILPDQLYAYLTAGAPIPAKSVMLTFDDSEEEHYTIAAAEMKKYGFKGVFFLMTVTLDRPGYLNKQEVKALSEEGHVIGSHTWDHHNVKKYEGQDWETQLVRPVKQLESITGKRVKYFAYPFGLWNDAAIPQLKKEGMIAAFQLVDKRSQQEPLYTIRRMIVPGEWSASQMLKRMRNNFN